MNLLETDHPEAWFSGILGLDKGDTGWRVQRFLPGQLARHAGTGEGRRIRTECAAGVVLHLMTDSAWLDVSFDCLGGARTYRNKLDPMRRQRA